jgi:hypothetical protein
MRPLLIAMLSLVPACLSPDDAPTLSSSSQGVVTHNKIGANKIGANKIGANKIGANKIGANKIAANKIALNVDAADDLLATADGQEVLNFLVSCALRADQTLVAILQDGTELDFFGDVGLAPEWIHRPLNQIDKGWVSACMFSRVNNHDVSLPISFRGPTHALATTPDELATYTLDEGAFYGQLFTPGNDPINWIACRGRDNTGTPTGGLADRDCARPDPANPGLTLCGFKFAGDCADFTPPPNRFACRRQTSGTFYVDCLDHAGFYAHHHDDDDDDDDFDRDRGCHGDDGTFKQVITTFTTP